MADTFNLEAPTPHAQLFCTLTTEGQGRSLWPEPGTGVFTQMLHPGVGVTPDFSLDTIGVKLAPEPVVTTEPTIAQYTNRLNVDTDWATQILKGYGLTHHQARALRVCFVDASRFRAVLGESQEGEVEGWSEPYGAWRQNPVTDDQEIWYTNLIGLPIEGAADLTEAGLKLLNLRLRHELGHCAIETRARQFSALNHQDEKGDYLPYRHKFMFGVVPVMLAVRYLRLRGHSEYAARWILDKDERWVRRFEREHVGDALITLRTDES